MDDRFLSRGKSKDSGEWVEGNLVFGNIIIPCTNDNMFFPYMRVSDCMTIENGTYITKDSRLKFYIVDPETVGGCTGLTDKNNKLMFEGDIIDHPCIKPINGKTIGKVFWDGIGWNIKGFYATHYDDPGSAFSEGTDYMTVIGNIYDNPKLLQDSRETG